MKKRDWIKSDKIPAMRSFILYCCLLFTFSLACTELPATSVPEDQTVPSGSVLFQDDFTRPVTGWDRLMAAEGIMDYDSGGYRMLVNALNTNFWSTPRKNLAEVRMEVDSGKLGGPDENRVGLICRFTGGDYYFFMISSDGFFGVGIFTGGQAVLLGQDEMQASAQIKTGLAVNHLRADCVGDALTFYVNGFELASVHDSTLTAGDVGLLAGTFEQPGVDVIFDNFLVLKP
jgi:hypothetical protein